MEKIANFWECARPSTAKINNFLSLHSTHWALLIPMKFLTCQKAQIHPLGAINLSLICANPESTHWALIISRLFLRPKSTQWALIIFSGRFENTSGRMHYNNLSLFACPFPFVFVKEGVDIQQPAQPGPPPPAAGRGVRHRAK